MHSNSNDTVCRKWKQLTTQRGDNHFSMEKRAVSHWHRNCMLKQEWQETVT